MKIKKFISAVSAAALTITSAFAAAPTVLTNAENPIVQTSFTPDPAPVVFGDELWVFTGRDRNADNDFYYMTGWQAFSTTDMKNWTNHGCFLEDDDFSWCNENDAWASQCIERNGKYYFYFTTTNKSGGGRQSVSLWQILPKDRIKMFSASRFAVRTGITLIPRSLSTMTGRLG